MSTTKSSIINLVWAFFLFSVFIINFALVMEYKRQVGEFQHFSFQRFVMAMRFMHDMQSGLEEHLEKIHVKKSVMPKEELQKRGEIVAQDPFSMMVQYNSKLYFIHKDEAYMPPPKEDFFRPKEFIKEDLNRMVLESSEEKSFIEYTLICLSINLMMVLFFIVVLKKLLKLKELKNKIRLFSEQSFFEPITIGSQDELGEITQEFNQAMEKIHRLKEARTLFLRNILHEIKTPIMKGKILTNSFENRVKKEQMEGVFAKLEALLVEMVKVEKLSANEFKLETKEYRLIDILDHSRDLLIMDSSRIEVSAEVAKLLHVDFELFATAVKNLLENALKYSDEVVHVKILDDELSIESYGEEIEKEKLDFSKLFNRKIEGAASGLGLGLYIVNEVVKKHGFKLGYEYKEFKNIFTIKF